MYGKRRQGGDADSPYEASINASDLIMISPCEMYMRRPKPQPTHSTHRRLNSSSQRLKGTLPISSFLGSSFSKSRTRIASKNRTFTSSPRSPIPGKRLDRSVIFSTRPSWTLPDPGAHGRSSTIRRIACGQLRLPDYTLARPQSIRPPSIIPSEGTTMFPETAFTIRQLRSHHNMRTRSDATAGQGNIVERIRKFAQRRRGPAMRRQLDLDVYMKQLGVGSVRRTEKGAREINQREERGNIVSEGIQCSSRVQRKIVVNITFNTENGHLMDQDEGFNNC